MLSQKQLRDELLIRGCCGILSFTEYPFILWTTLLTSMACWTVGLGKISCQYRCCCCGIRATLSWGPVQTCIRPSHLCFFQWGLMMWFWRLKAQVSDDFGHSHPLSIHRNSLDSVLFFFQHTQFLTVRIWVPRLFQNATFLLATSSFSDVLHCPLLEHYPLRSQPTPWVLASGSCLSESKVNTQRSYGFMRYPNSRTSTSRNERLHHAGPETSP